MYSMRASEQVCFHLRACMRAPAPTRPACLSSKWRTPLAFIHERTSAYTQHTAATSNSPRTAARIVVGGSAWLVHGSINMGG